MTTSPIQWHKRRVVNMITPSSMTMMEKGNSQLFNLTSQREKRRKDMSLPDEV